jgi:hypothetical protein
MTRLRMRTLCGSVVVLALITGAQRGFAIEPGDFGQYLGGQSIGGPLAAPAPAGVYMVMDAFVSPAGVGVGQNLGTTVSVPLWEPTILWSTGFQMLGANFTMLATAPFYLTAAYPTNGTTLGGNGSGPPFGGAIWSETVANTRLTPILAQWNLGQGLFAAAGLTLIVPDGSRYNGTLNPDYLTYEPTVAFAYISKDWRVIANFVYDINDPSTGHTGTYQIVANAPPVSFNPALAAAIASIGNGYTSGQQAFLDFSATYAIGKFEIGPVASFKWQTTADSPGGGLTCAQTAALLGPTLGCGRATNYAVGGLVGYNFGIVDLQVWATDSVFAQDDFKGVGVYTRLTFRMWGPDQPGKPLATKGAAN